MFTKFERDYLETISTDELNPADYFPKEIVDFVISKQRVQTMQNRVSYFSLYEMKVDYHCF